MNRLIDDIRYAFLRLKKDWKFSFACIFCLSVGIASTVSIYTVLRSIVFAPLPFAEPDSLVMIRTKNVQRRHSPGGACAHDFFEWRNQLTSFESLAAYRLNRFDFPNEMGGYDRALGFEVSEDFFQVLRIRPHLGTTFKEMPSKSRRRIMLSTNLWQSMMRGKAEAIGEPIKVNTWMNWPEVGSIGFNLVGVLPANLKYLPSGAFFSNDTVGPDANLAYCIPMNEHQLGSRTWREWQVIGRLKPGVSLEQAQEEVKLVADRVAQSYPDSHKDWSAKVVTLSQHIYGDVRPIVMIMFAASCLVMTIACGNASQLMSVRFARRQSELAIQSAVGASPIQLCRQLGMEATIIATSSGFIGFALAMRCSQMIFDAIPAGIPKPLNSGVDLTVVVYALLASFASVFVISLVPMRKLFSNQLLRSLSQSGRTATQSKNLVRFSNYIVVASLFSSCVLLVAFAMLLYRMRALTETELGFQPDNRLTVTISLPQAKHEWNHNSRFCNQVIENVSHIPGVISAGSIAGLPMGNFGFDCRVFVEGKPAERIQDLPRSYIRVVTDDYFRTMGIPLLKGRLFEPPDSVGEIGGNRTVVISQSIAEYGWPGEDPIGQRMKTVDAIPWMEVVGVVADVRHTASEEVTFDVYYPEKLFPQPQITLIVHVDGAPGNWIDSVRKEVLKADPDAYISQIHSMNEVIARSQALPRFILALVSTLAISGGLLALTGIYLNTVFSVSGRQREMEIRVICGATPWHVILHILGGIGRVVLVGLSIGVLCSYVVFMGRAIQHSEQESIAFSLVAVPLILGAAAVIACISVATKIAFERRLR